MLLDDLDWEQTSAGRTLGAHASGDFVCEGSIQGVGARSFQWTYGRNSAFLGCPGQGNAGLKTRATAGLETGATKRKKGCSEEQPC